MALRNVLKIGNETLRKVSREVVAFDKKLWTLLDDMKDTLETTGGIGLAAPQLGILRRVIIIDIDDGKGAVELINPVIVTYSGTQRKVEGCLSLEGQWGYVVRPERVTIQAQDRNGGLFEKNGDELLATAFCHEIDHLNGILFTDLADEMVDDPNKRPKRGRRR